MGWGALTLECCNNIYHWKIQMPHNYTSDIEEILNNIRINCVLFHKAHKSNFLTLKEHLKYYKIPIIIISSISSIISLSQVYIDQNTITILNMSFGLLCSIIGSIELFFGISNQMINELSVSKEYEILALEIYKCLTMAPENRNTDGKTFLEQCFGTYIKLIEKSNLLKPRIHDRLLMIPATTDIQKSIRSGKTDLSLIPTPRPSIFEWRKPTRTSFQNEKKTSVSSQHSELALETLVRPTSPTNIIDLESQTHTNTHTILPYIQTRRTSFDSVVFESSHPNQETKREHEKEKDLPIETTI